MCFAVIPSEARNPSSIKMPRKERFLTSRTPLGMTSWTFLSKLLGISAGPPAGRPLLLRLQFSHAIRLSRYPCEGPLLRPRS